MAVRFPTHTPWTNGNADQDAERGQERADVRSLLKKQEREVFEELLQVALANFR